MTAPAGGAKLPSAVQRQADAANKMIKDLNTPPAAPAPAAPPSPPSSGQPPAPPAAAAAAPPAPTPEERARLAEARYASLQGKYNAETTALRNQVEENTLLVRDLLTRPAPATPATVPSPPQSPEDFLKSLGATDADIKDYGELLPIVVRLAQNMYQPTIGKLEAELTQLRNAAVQNATASVEERKQAIWDALDRSVQQWRVINESDHFLDWLRIVDIFSGVTRHVALASAFKNLDRARVVAIFEAYAREHPEQARAPGAPIVDPETLVVPPTQGGQPPVTPEGSGSKKVWTEGEIRNFYTRVRKKLVSAEEYQRFQSEIAAATAEGRIKPDRPDIHANR
ncbi:MAG TPA: hypothetical protein VIJ38_02120 [Acidobacteriaceae bacterium]